MRKSKYAVELTEYERAQLRTLIGRGAGPARTLAHARILLRANRGEGGPSIGAPPGPRRRRDTQSPDVGCVRAHLAAVVPPVAATPSA